MKIFEVKVRAFNRHGFIPLSTRNSALVIHASSARVAVNYALRDLTRGPLKGRRADSFQITVSTLGNLPTNPINHEEVSND